MARPPIMFRKERGRLIPGDAYAVEQINNLQDGIYNARLSRMTQKGKEEREGMRGLWWAGCTLLSQNVDHPLWDSPRKAHDSILRGLGYVRPRFRIDGSYDMIPVSTSDSEMDDEEFSILQEKARAFCEEKFGFDPFATWVEQQEAMK